MARPGSPFRTVLSHPGALGFSGAGILSRLELAMGSLGVVLLVTGTGGSYTLATVLTGTHAIALAVVNPLIARLIDRHGQRRILRLQVAVYLPALAGFVIGVHADAPLPLLVGLALIEGAAHPMVMNLVRARWSWIFRGTGELKTAFAWESMLDAAVIALGAPLATFLAIELFPSSALLVAGGTLGISALLLAAQRSTEPPPVPALPRAPRVRGRTRVGAMPGVLVLTAIMTFLGANLGAFDVAALGRADEFGQTQLAGWMLAVYAIGSTLGGVLIGRSRRGTLLPRQYALLLGGLTIGAIPLVFLTLPALLVVFAFTAGVFIAPTIIIGMTIMEAVAPHGRVTEAMAWTGVGMLVGRAFGQVAAGWAVDGIGAGPAFCLVSGFAAIACAIACLASPRLNHLVPARTSFRGPAAATTAIPLASGPAGDHGGPAVRGRR